MPPYEDDKDEMSDHEQDIGEQVRVSLTLSADCEDRSLEVPNEPIAVPADICRKGLAAVINHLLDRKQVDDDEDDDDDDDRLEALPFDFIVGPNNPKLLRMGVEKEARRIGLSLEQAIPITYFPAQEPPELSGESEPLPDWISALSFVESNYNNKPLLCSATYDGSIQVFSPIFKESGDEQQDKGEMVLRKVATKEQAHGGPIQCLDADRDDSSSQIWIATGSMDHTLRLHRLEESESVLQAYAECIGGHASAIGSMDLWGSARRLASGDWDGGICLWDLGLENHDDDKEQQATKKIKTGSKSKSRLSTRTIEPKISIQAHTSNVSGLSFGNLEKQQPASTHRQLITGSWDHSLKVWDLERQDCLLTLNGSRVVSCLDTSYHSSGIVATGHPDCMVRLWDLRTDHPSRQEASLKVSDNTFKPSHKAWVSAVKWSRCNPYHLASTSHDGSVKLWDIRSPLPLHSVTAFGKDDKALCLAFGQVDDARFLLAGGTDGIIKQFASGH